MDKKKTTRQLEQIIRRFVTSVGRKCPDIKPDSDLHREAGLSSDEGVCIVLDICTDLGVEIPDDFNAVVHESGKRARTLDELAECVVQFGGKS